MYSCINRPQWTTYVMVLLATVADCNSTGSRLHLFVGKSAKYCECLTEIAAIFETAQYLCRQYLETQRAML